MTIGAVFLSFQVALVGSIYVSIARDLAFLPGLAVYSMIGSAALAALLLGTAFATASSRF